MEAQTFRKFRDIVYAHSGISLGDGKEALVSARVGKRLRALNISDHKGYLKYLEQDGSGEEIVQLLDAISTNVTHFFREPVHFDFVRDCMAKWLGAGQTRFRFWSAACSTGEEPYSLAITLREALGNRQADVKILATDISTRVLNSARAGIFELDKLAKVPPALRDRYFERPDDGRANNRAVRADLRRMIVFQRLNLANPPFPMRGPLDAVFCRNVMIYFDNRVRAALLAEIVRLLKPGGYLFVGHAESLTGMMADLKSVKPSIYVKNR
ncbi:methyltransferase domain-containing protein [bacterium]|nr:methyltransferase domain-containing protein [bacterium]